MKKIIRFYKEDTRWFADLPEYIEAGGERDDLEMVMGADDWLDELSDYGEFIALRLSTEKLRNKITISDWDDSGATYIAHEYNEETVNHVLWLCAVTKFVFGEFPETIYYEKINLR